MAYTQWIGNYVRGSRRGLIWAAYLFKNWVKLRKSHCHYVYIQTLLLPFFANSLSLKSLSYNIRYGHMFWPCRSSSEYTFWPRLEVCTSQTQITSIIVWATCPVNWAQIVKFQHAVTSHKNRINYSYFITNGRPTALKKKALTRMAICLPAPNSKSPRHTYSTTWLRLGQ